MASILGFADVLGLMALDIWLAYKHQRGWPAGRQRLRPMQARR